LWLLRRQKRLQFLYSFCLNTTKKKINIQTIRLDVQASFGKLQVLMVGMVLAVDGRRKQMKKATMRQGLTVQDLRRATELQEAIEKATADHQGQLDKLQRDFDNNVGKMQRELAGLLGGTGIASAPTGKVRRQSSGSENVTATGRPRNEMTLRDAIAKVVKRSPKTLNEIVDGVTALGYKFASQRPANSVGAFLYGRHGKKDFRAREGRFEFIGR
jgi:hypothetical protein